MLSGKNFTLKKGITGRYSVSYDCPHCGTQLTSPLKQAGTTDDCPECARKFVVPGEAELVRITSKREAAQKEREQRIDSDRQAKEADFRRAVRHAEEERARSAETRKRQAEDASRLSNALPGLPIDEPDDTLNSWANLLTVLASLAGLAALILFMVALGLREGPSMGLVYLACMQVGAALSLAIASSAFRWAARLERQGYHIMVCVHRLALKSMSDEP